MIAREKYRILAATAKFTSARQETTYTRERCYYLLHIHTYVRIYEPITILYTYYIHIPMLELNPFGLIQIKFSTTKSYFKNIYKILINDKR